MRGLLREERRGLEGRSGFFGSCSDVAPASPTVASLEEECGLHLRGVGAFVGGAASACARAERKLSFVSPP